MKQNKKYYIYGIKKKVNIHKKKKKKKKVHIIMHILIKYYKQKVNGVLINSHLKNKEIKKPPIFYSVISTNLIK